MKDRITENRINYKRHGDYYLPEFELPEFKPIGKYGRMHLRFIKEYHRPFYSAMLLKGALSYYIADVDKRAKEEIERLIPMIAEKQGIDEELKVKDQMAWVKKMNNIKLQAEEIVCHHIVFKR